MQFCRNFGGQGFVFTKDADCHGPQDFYRGSYYAVRITLTLPLPPRSRILCPSPLGKPGG